MRSEFTLYEIMKDFYHESLSFAFDDDSTLAFTADDFGRYYLRKMQDALGLVSGEVKELNHWESFKKAFTNWNRRKSSTFTHIKDSLELEYNVLDNYNGHIESTMTDTYDKTDTLSFTGRSDTRTLNNSDTLSFNNRSDTRTHNDSDTLSFTNRVDTHAYDSNNPMTETTTKQGTTHTDNYVAGFNQSDANLESSSDVTVGYGGMADTTTTTSSGSETDTKSGSEVNAHSGTITDAKTGSEVNSHSGTITDAKNGSEATAQDGTITHEYEETKRGNLGVTTSQQMLESEIKLRLIYNLIDLMVDDFVKDYCYY